MGNKTRKTLIDGKSWDEDCDIIIADEAIGRVSLVSADLHSATTMMGFEDIELERNRVLEINDMIEPNAIFLAAQCLISYYL